MSESTWFRGSIVLVFIAFTWTFARSVMKSESIKDALAQQQVSSDAKDKAQQEWNNGQLQWQREMTSALNEVTKEIVGMRGDLTSTVKDVGGLQVNGTQAQRDDAARDLTIARLQADVDALKRDVASISSGVKAAEGRLISIEIAASRAVLAPAPTPQGGDGK
jgi:hypothetical protein